ncbi:hypothetical protein P7K49_035508, partial [Saguinus oedipus]
AGPLVLPVPSRHEPAGEGPPAGREEPCKAHSSLAAQALTAEPPAPPVLKRALLVHETGRKGASDAEARFSTENQADTRDLKEP